MSPRLISFDLDGTLVDTAGEIAEAVNRTLESLGLPRREPSQWVRHIGAGTRELMRRVSAQLAAEGGWPADAPAFDAMMAVFDRHYEATTGTDAQPYAGCHDMLDRLQAAGVQLACVTNKEAHFAHIVLDQHGLDRYFGLVIGGDTLPQKKPDAAVLVHVMRHFGVDAAATAHVGDSATDVQAARNAGVAAWAVPHGYNGGLPIETADPDRLFPDLPSIAHAVLAPAA